MYSIITTLYCLGKIPLRQLVYRVLDLPPSMKPLVYDFGQLNDSTEKDYTEQIVKGRCSRIVSVKKRPDVIKCVSNVLSWCQSYMRKRKVYMMGIFMYIIISLCTYV